MSIVIYEDIADFPDLDQFWSEKSKHAHYYCRSWQDYLDFYSMPDTRLRLVVSRRQGDQTVVAPFVLAKFYKSFTVGDRRLMRLPIAAQTLFSQWLMQDGSKEQIQDIFQSLERYSDFDWIVVGEVPVGSNVHNVINNLGWKWIISSPSQKLSYRWLIDLPDDFETYLQGLSSSSRQSTRRKMRNFEKKFDTKLEIVSEATDIGRFVAEGERISRTTYQWDIGQRLQDDKATHTRYRALTNTGRLRCYLLSVNGSPIAFLRGTIEAGGLFHYETPGFDPEYEKYSVGTVLLMFAIRDLIENTECNTFDFGSGGDNSGYKSTYGNRFIKCENIEIGRRLSMRANLIAYIQKFINKSKYIMDRIIEKEQTRTYIKKFIRKKR